jgi:hypothetical protein
MAAMDVPDGVNVAGSGGGERASHPAGRTATAGPAAGLPVGAEIGTWVRYQSPPATTAATTARAKTLRDIALTARL